jgi:hypothetical protein
MPFVGIAPTLNFQLVHTHTHTHTPLSNNAFIAKFGLVFFFCPIVLQALKTTRIFIDVGGDFMTIRIRENFGPLIIEKYLRRWASMPAPRKFAPEFKILQSLVETLEAVLENVPEPFDEFWKGMAEALKKAALGSGGGGGGSGLDAELRTRIERFLGKVEELQHQVNPENPQ